MEERGASTTIESFAAALASEAPTPGGGSAAAAAVALGAALVAMSGQLTLGRRRYRDVQDQMQRMVARADAIRTEALALIDADAAAYAKLLEAFRLPRAPVARQTTRAEAVAQAALGASRVPAAVGGLGLEVIALAATAVAQSNPRVRSDAAAGAALARGALRICEMNITANAGLVDDDAARSELEGSCERFRAALACADAAADDVLAGMRP